MPKDHKPHVRYTPSTPEAVRLLLRPARPSIKSISRPSKAIRNILRPMGKKFGPGVRELKQRWLEIAGPRLAAVSTPKKISGVKGSQTLTIVTKGSAAMLVQAQSTQLLEKINLLVGMSSVKSIRIIQGPILSKNEPDPVPNKKTVYSPKQLTALDEQLKDITNPALKAALRQLGLGVIGRSK